MTIDLTDKLHCYIFGYLWADGYLRRNTVAVSLKDEDLIILMNDIFGGKIKTRNRIQTETGKLKIIHEIFINDKQLVCDILNKGFRKNINNIPKENIPSFLLGYLDGDGCIYYDGKNQFQVSYSSKYDENWNWFFELTKNLGFKFYHGKGKTYCKSLGKHTKFSKVRITSYPAYRFVKYLYDNVNHHYLSRKKVKYDQFVVNKHNLIQKRLRYDELTNV